MKKTVSKEDRALKLFWVAWNTVFRMNTTLSEADRALKLFWVP